MIPTKVRIGSVDYFVTEHTDLHDNGRELLGHVLYDCTAIKLEEHMPVQRKVGVLIHEIVHAIFHEAGYTEQDEDMVTRLSNVLHGVLRDNDFDYVRKAGE